MEHIAAIMMLVGCGQGNAECREIAAPAVGFETVEECHELLRPSIRQAQGRFKTVFGKCAEIDPALYIEDATITWDITPSNELDVRIDFDSPQQPVIMAQRTGRSEALQN